jgi:hypothetical protein
MSYCRWSSDDFQCDVYCYAHCDGGFRIHVATNRPTFKEPLPPPAAEGDSNAWVARVQKVMKMLDDAERKPIGLSLDGQTFHEATEMDCVKRLLEIRTAGYNVPQYAIDDLRAEAEQEARAQ